MNFAELRFWELLALGAVILTALRFLWQLGRWDIRFFDKCALGTLGLFLLGCVSALTLCIFLTVLLGTYGGLAWILQKPIHRRFKYLFLLVPIQLFPLLYYKYGAFVANGVLGWNVDLFQNLAIPVGISFYTFQKIGFVVDTLHFKKPLPRFVDYVNFASFFPQIVAGPIERRENLLPQLENFRFRWLPSRINEGACWIALGLFFKCCLADNLALYFHPEAKYNAYRIWLANLLFGLRIYYDFAGYSLVALGIGLCLGIRLTLNFASPYSASNATEFWRRWHITLSQWFRDYIYVPLGGGRVRWWAFNVLLVFAVSGIWHGAGWNFLLWGLFHGLLLILHRTVGRHVRIPTAVSWSITMLAVFTSWLCFYETRTDVLLTKLGTLATPSAYGLSELREAIGQWSGPDALVVGAMLTLTLASLTMEWRSVARSETPYARLLSPRTLPFLIVATILLAPGKQNEFIYFAF